MQTGKIDREERPNELHLRKLDCDGNSINITFNKSYSDDDLTPSEMNCKKVIDKPTLVKRLTMGLLRINDQESRPLGSYKFIFVLNRAIKMSFLPFPLVKFQIVRHPTRHQGEITFITTSMLVFMM